MNNKQKAKDIVTKAISSTFNLEGSVTESNLALPAALMAAKVAGAVYLNNADEINSYASNAIKAVKHQFNNSEIGMNVELLNFCKRRHMDISNLPNYVKRLIIVALNNTDPDAVAFALHRKIRHEEILVDMGSGDHWIKEKVTIPIRFYIRTNSDAMGKLIESIDQPTTSEYMKQRLRFFTSGSFIAEFSIVNGQIIGIYKS